MFCQECGNTLVDNAKFCPKCGFKVDGKVVKAETYKKELDKNTPIFKVKPVFISWVVIVSMIPIQLFFTVWMGGFFGGFSTVFIKMAKINIPEYVPFVFFAGLAFFGIPFLAYFSQKNTYSKTVYTFYEDRLEYMEGFWTVEKKVVKYKNVIEINLRHGIVQKGYGLGTLVLSTPATGSRRGRAISGIRVADIRDSERIYKKLQDLID